MALDAKRHKRLLDGRNMTCPRCRVSHDVLRYVPMGMIEEYIEETNPIYKCPSCRWVFSPALTIKELCALFGVETDSGESK